MWYTTVMAAELNLNQLRCLHAVIKTGSFSKAADELCVSEPAVFVQVRSLERYVGFKLLEKFKKELIPTESGRLLYHYAEKIFDLVEEAGSAVEELRDLKTGYLRIGATRAVCQYLMPAVISVFQDQHPLVKVHLDEGRSVELVHGVARRRYEIAILGRVNYPEGVTSLTFSRDEVLLIVSPESELAQRDRVSFQELAREPVVCSDSGSGVRAALENAFEKRGLKPLATIEAANPEFIKSLVKQGKGYSFLASLAVREEVRRGELVALPLTEGNFHLDIDVIYLKDRILSPAASAFLNFLKEHRNTHNLGRLTDAMNREASVSHKRLRIPPRQA
jgi:DNA-binding transcriptional LysR family regulator